MKNKLRIIILFVIAFLFFFGCRHEDPFKDFQATVKVSIYNTTTLPLSIQSITTGCGGYTESKTIEPDHNFEFIFQCSEHAEFAPDTSLKINCAYQDSGMKSPYAGTKTGDSLYYYTSSFVRDGYGKSANYCSSNSINFSNFKTTNDFRFFKDNELDRIGLSTSPVVYNLTCSFEYDSLNDKYILCELK